MNVDMTHAIDIGLIAATYIAVGAFSILVYSMIRNRSKAASSAHESEGACDISSYEALQSQQPGMSFVSFGDISTQSLSRAATPRDGSPRNTGREDRDAIIRLIQERLRQESPAERLAESMNRK
jgi:hypothetical protein